MDAELGLELDDFSLERGDARAAGVAACVMRGKHRR